MHPVRSALFLTLCLFLASCGSDAPTTGGATPTTVPSEVSASDTPPAMDRAAGGSEKDPTCEATSRKSYEGRPIISVSEPCAGDALTSPATVAGEANVFEATVSLRVLDENGKEIGTAFTTAECGTGCWGAFEGEIEFDVDREQMGTLEIFESSAEDGSDLHKVSIDVTLLP